MLAEDNGEIPLKAIFHAFCTVTHRIIWPYIDSSNGTCLMVHTGQESVITTPINDIIVCRIHCNMGRFPSCGLLPVIFTNTGTIAPVVDTDGGIILLGHINTVWKRIVRCHPIKLGSRLIVICAPSFPGIIGYLGPTVISDDHSIGIFRSDPKIMVIPMRSIESAKSFTTIRRFMVINVQDINDILIFGIGIKSGIVPCSLA